MATNMMTHKYDNNIQGVVAYMQWAYKAKFLKTLDVASCIIHEDPSVDGVWAVDSPKTGYRCIIYLAGYNDPWGNPRPHNDNEEGTVPTKTIKAWLRSGKVTLDMLKVWVKYDTLRDDEYDKLVDFLDA